MCQHDELQAILAKAKIYPSYERVIETYRYVESVCKIKRRHRVALSKQAKTAKVLQENFLNNLPNAMQLDSLREELTAQLGLNLENKIIQYWHQGNTFQKAKSNDAPWGVVQCVSQLSIQRYYPEKSSRLLLDKDSLATYLNFPADIVLKLETIRRLPLLCDLVRTALLFCYGGTWLDFTILLLNKLPDYCLEGNPFFYLRHGELNIEGWQRDVWERHFIAHSPYYFSWDSEFKVNQLNSVIHAKAGDQLLGTMLYILLSFHRQYDAREYEYFIYMILFDILLDTPQFSYLKANLTQDIPSDACCHLLQVLDYKKFNENLYHEMCTKYPVQKLNGGCRLIKGALLYETLRRQQLL